MTIGTVVLLVGHVLLPGSLLWLGHNYRHREPATKGVFWGGVLGYLVSVAAVLAFLVIPPVYWGSEVGPRWIGIHVTPLVIPVLSALAARSWIGGGSG